MRHRILLVVCLSLTLVAAVRETSADESATISRQFIYETAPFPSCHASTIEETAEGLVAAWFGGTREGHEDVAIWVSRRTEGKWSAPVEVANGVQADGARHPCWNPVLFQPKQGPLLLFYKVGPSPQRWWGELKTSADGGQSWSKAERLPDGILGPIKNKPVQLADGTILSPTSTETPERPSQWRVHFERSTDGGKTWTKIVPAAAEGKEIDAIQPSLLVHSDGKLQAIGRTRSGRLFETWSSDQGQSWTALTLTELPNPNSGTDAVTLDDGTHLLIYNHTSRGRTPLSLAGSKDGKSWEGIVVLESEPGEYSYPAIIQTRDGQVHITYTWNREKIRHVVIDNPAKLAHEPIVDGKWPAKLKTDD